MEINNWRSYRIFFKSFRNLLVPRRYLLPYAFEIFDDQFIWQINITFSKVCHKRICSFQITNKKLIFVPTEIQMPYSNCRIVFFLQKINFSYTLIRLWRRSWHDDAHCVVSIIRKAECKKPKI